MNGGTRSAGVIRDLLNGHPGRVHTILRWVQRKLLRRLGPSLST